MDDLTGYVITALLSLIVGLLLRYFESKANLVFWQPHFAQFDVPKSKDDPETFPVQTDSISIQNLGSKSSENIEIVFKSEPDHFMFTPSVPYVSEKLKGGRFLVKIESLGKKEFITLHILSYFTIPSVEYIRSKEGPAKSIPFQMQRQFPYVVQVFLALMLLVGVATTAYWLIKFAYFMATGAGLL